MSAAFPKGFVTLAWNELGFVRDILPASFADLDAVLPAITLSVTMLVIVSLITRPSDDCPATDSQQPREPVNNA